MNQSAEHNPKDILRAVYATALEEEATCSELCKGKPLYHAARVEKHFRRLFLDNEELADLSNEFFLGYAQRNPHILTPEARRVVKILAENHKNHSPRIYVVELDVPDTGNIAKHLVDMDLVSFLDIQRTQGFLEQRIQRPSGIAPFSHRHQKGNLDSRYWVMHSVTRKRDDYKEEITDIKLRKRVHGTGHQLSEGQIADFHRLGTGHIVDAFAH